MSKKFAYILAIVAPAAACSFLIWIFNLHGTGGLFHVEMIYRVAIIPYAALSALPLIILVISRVIRRKKTVRSGLNIAVMSISSVSILLSVFAFPYLSGFPAPPPTDLNPRLIAGSPGANGVPDMVVAAESKEPAQFSLTWGNSTGSFTTRETAASHDHTFLLRDLEPDSRYWYRIGDGPEYYFSTAPNTQPLHFAVGSDAHFGAGDASPALTEKMLQQIADPVNDFDYFFSLGDLVEYGFRLEQWHLALNALSTTTSSIPTVFAAGNHDVMFTGLSRYLQYCSPAAVESDPGSRLWRRFDVGDIHFLVMDMEWSAESFNSKQKAWLETELQSIPAEDWTIVLNHGFYYASGSIQNGWKWYDNPETIQAVTPLFEKYGVDIVFSGHAHQMEILQHSGVTYIIAGSFGGIPDPERTYISPASLWYASGNYGFVDVTIEMDQAQIAFTGPEGQLLKSVTVEKNGIISSK